MALVQIPVKIGAVTDGVVPLSVGPNTYSIAISELKRIFLDRDELALRHYLLCQMSLVLQQAGLNPATATAAQMKTAIEAQQYWV
jgi:hypothetical protein